MAVTKKSNGKKSPPRRSIKTYAFIDTNIFLDFYRSQNEATITLLSKLESVADRIICTYQVEMEFLKNRQAVLLKAADNIKPDIPTNIPAVVSDKGIGKALKKRKQDADKQYRRIKKRINSLLTDPASNDIVYRTLAAIFASSAPYVLTRDMDERKKIKRLATRRFFLGYPPRKKNDTSIGDGLNWEWLVHCGATLKLPGRFVIVSRDNDYGCKIDDKYILNDQLKSEFRQRVGKKSIALTGRLSEALERLEVKVTKKEQQAEADLQQSGAIKNTASRPSIRDIQDYVSHLSAKFSHLEDPSDAISHHLLEWYNGAF